MWLDPLYKPEDDVASKSKLETRVVSHRLFDSLRRPTTPVIKL